MLNNNPHIYLISDSTGETVSIVARSVYARFENINFNGKNISVIGEDQLTTIIDGGQYDRVVTFENNETNLSLLKNFTIQNGINFDEFGDGGGGIYVFNASPILDNLKIVNNQSYNHGGGLYIVNSTVIIKNSTIKENMFV